MQKSLALLLFVFMFNSIKAQVSSDCTVPQLLVNEYERDIKQLAIRRLFELQSPDTALVRIPNEWTDTISEGLAAIFNASSIPEKDSVFNLYCVHNNNNWPYDYAGFLIRVDTNYSWTQAWRNMNTMTGNLFIDSILTKYHLQIDEFYYWSIGNYALLSTDSSWNIFALMDSIEMTPGVFSVETNGIIGSAGSISYDKVGNDRYYNFYFEFNDCTDGCDNYRVWKFKVNADCSVNYLGYNDWGVFGVLPLPPPLNCNAFTSISDIEAPVNLTIFPNPATDRLTITTSNSFKNAKFFIFDSAGRQLKMMELSEKEVNIDVSSYNNGLYFYKIIKANEEIIKSGKLIIMK